MKSLSDFIGKRVRIVGQHPHNGEYGNAVKTEQTIIGQGLRIRLDNGRECFVFKTNHIKLAKG